LKRQETDISLALQPQHLDVAGLRLVATPELLPQPSIIATVPPSVL
jgi:hypothetical protein